MTTFEMSREVPADNLKVHDNCTGQSTIPDRRRWEFSPANAMSGADTGGIFCHVPSSLNIDQHRFDLVCGEIADAVL